MKHFAVTFLFLMFIITVSVNAQEKKTAVELANSVTEAYAAKTLSGLDAEKPYLGKVTVIMESSMEKKSQTKTFTSFEKIEAWLTSLEKEELPSRETKTLKQCKKGVCTYDFSAGILHNQLYIKKINYSYSKGRYYIKTITLLNGD